jgi:hypothetical protein
VNEQQLARRMRAVLADEPPLGFDPDEVVEVAHRRRRQRLMAFASVSATAVVIAVVVAVVAAIPRHEETADDPNGGDRPVRTCGDLDLDGSEPRDHPDVSRRAKTLDKLVPRLLDEHIEGFTFEPVLDGMRPYGCVPTLMAAYKPTDADWFISIRLFQRHDVLTSDDDRYIDFGPDYEQTLDGSLVRVYHGYHQTGDNAGSNVVVPEAATRLDPDGLVVEVTLTQAGAEVTMGELIAVVTDPDLRF